MKILLTTIPIDEDIHEIENRYSEVVARISPDYVFIVAGEAMSIHSHMISELHMFEYSNVRFATWNLIEDILYRLEDLPEYHISVYPMTGEYTCKETGYRGRFEGVKYPVGYIQYEYVRKIVEREPSQKIEYIIYSGNGGDALLVWDAFKPLIDIDAIFHNDFRIRYLDDNGFGLEYLTHSYINVGWREVKPLDNLGNDEVGIIKLLAYIIDNGFLEGFFERELRRRFLDRVDDILSKLEYIFYSSTTSDREGYELKISHGTDVGILLSKCAIIKYFLERFDNTSPERLNELPVNCAGEEAIEILNHINRYVHGESEKIVKEDFLDRFVQCFR